MDHGLRVRDGAEAVARIDKADAGLRGASLVHRGIADVDTALLREAVSLHQKPDVAALFLSGSSIALEVLHIALDLYRSQDPAGILDEGLDVTILTVRHDVHAVALLMETLDRLHAARIEISAVGTKVLVLVLHAVLHDQCPQLLRDIRQHHAADFIHRVSHIAVHIVHRDLHVLRFRMTVQHLLPGRRHLTRRVP